MKVLILGSGVLGTTTAYYLASRGHEVEVLDRAGQSAMETSFANGGQLSFSHSEPWATPTVLPKILKWLGKEDAPLIFRFGTDFNMYRWGLSFLRNCTTARTGFNSANLLRLGLYSKQCINVVQQETGVEFDNLKLGTLHIYSNQHDLDLAVAQAKYQEQFGCPFTVLDRDGVMQLEPALANTRRPIIGAVHYTADESGDVHKFTVNLAAYCRDKLGVKFHYNTPVDGIEAEGKAITAVRSGDTRYTADAYVMALGSYSAMWARKLGFYLPIYPMKGYSITIPLENGGECAPKVSITDTEKKIVYSRLGDRLRVAGTAEFAGFNTDIRDTRVGPIVKAAMELFPNCGDPAKVVNWAGLRPATPHGSPILGKTKYPNLYLNTGHGTLGWTLSCGSSRVVADIIEGKAPEIKLDGYCIA